MIIRIKTLISVFIYPYYLHYIKFIKFLNTMCYRMIMDSAEIGIIGGTGVYDPELLEDKKEVSINTSYGSPSDMITLGTYEGRRIAVLPRHGKNHTIPPHKINFRANIYALKQLGVTRIRAPCAVGSLQDDLKPGVFVLVDQVIDRTSERKSTFYEEEKVCHIDVADPVCSEVKNLLVGAANKLNLSHHPEGTYVCIQGPKFSTRAESKLYRNWGGHVIGMTLVPECVLAREAEICYTSIAMVTDYDTFREQAVSIEGIINTMKSNVERVKSLLIEVISQIPKERTCACKDALKGAFAQE
jgi:5'-methylthioadenosine phosphorylase